MRAAEEISSLGYSVVGSNSFLKELAIESQEIRDVNFTVFPNPNDGNFMVKITGELQPYTMEIFNNLGKLLGVINGNNEVVNITRSDLGKGIYYIKLTMNGKASVKKIIVR